MTFTFDPEAGDRMVCPNCGATGIVLKILRGRMYLSWKTHGFKNEDAEQPWSRRVSCGFCKTHAEEVRYGR